MAEASFTDLRDIVRELAQAQVRTEARVEELAQAQTRTEARLEALTAHVGTLAIRMEELAQAQLRTENEVTHLRRTLETQLGGLGARWGIQTEEAFRNAMKTILEEVGFKAKRYLSYDTEGEVFGRPDQVELDVVIQDGKVIVLEIKSALDRGHVHLFARKVAFYTRKTSQEVARQVIVTPYPEWGARELAEVLGMEICTDASAFR
jgi:hypothetical protein